MKTGNNFTAILLNRAVLKKQMLVGGAIALAFILAFLLPAGKPDPQWGSYWMVKPLIIVPAAGVAGGAIYYIIISRLSRALTKIPAFFLGITVFVCILWIGTVLGLNGTYWD